MDKVLILVAIFIILMLLHVILHSLIAVFYPLLCENLSTVVTKLKVLLPRRIRS